MYQPLNSTSISLFFSSRNLLPSGAATPPPVCIPPLTILKYVLSLSCIIGLGYLVICLVKYPTSMYHHSSFNLSHSLISSTFAPPKPQKNVYFYLHLSNLFLYKAKSGVINIVAILIYVLLTYFHAVPFSISDIVN